MILYFESILLYFERILSYFQSALLDVESILVVLCKYTLVLCHNAWAKKRWQLIYILYKCKPPCCWGYHLRLFFFQEKKGKQQMNMTLPNNSEPPFFICIVFFPFLPFVCLGWVGIMGAFRHRSPGSVAEVHIPGSLHPLQFHGGQYSHEHQLGGQRGERHQCAPPAWGTFCWRLVGWDTKKNPNDGEDVEAKVFPTGCMFLNQTSGWISLWWDNLMILRSLNKNGRTS